MNDHPKRVVEVENLCKVFPGPKRGPKNLDTYALRGVSLSINAAEIVCLVGASGSGKTTLGKMLMGFESVTRGRITFAGVGKITSGQRIASRKLVRHRQMIFQNPETSLNSFYSVASIIGRTLAVAGIIQSIKTGSSSIRAILEQVGLHPAEEYLEKYPHELSGGQQQRVAIARSMALKPALLIADEPVSMLDVSLRVGILQLLMQARERDGSALLYITHDLGTAYFIGDRIMVMKSGVIVEEGTTDEIFQHPQHPYTLALMRAQPSFSKRIRVADRQVPVVAGTGNEALTTTVADISGCPFRSECPHAFESCNELPAWTDVAPSHRVRCHGIKRTD